MTAGRVHGGSIISRMEVDLSCWSTNHTVALGGIHGTQWHPCGLNGIIVDGIIAGVRCWWPVIMDQCNQMRHQRYTVYTVGHPGVDPATPDPHKTAENRECEWWWRHGCWDRAPQQSRPMVQHLGWRGGGTLQVFWQGCVATIVKLWSFSQRQKVQGLTGKSRQFSIGC